MLIQIGNTKLGAFIANFSLPAKESCFPSVACGEVCYGLKKRYRMQYIQDLYQRNWDATYEENFIQRISLELETRKLVICRWHTVGDYFRYSDDEPDKYVRIVDEIVQRHPHIFFYSYTRSWTQADLRPALSKLSSRRNFRLWLSSDYTMPRPPKWKYVKHCYMALSDEDVPNYPVDLVFRAGPQDVPMKKDQRGNQVCPYEQGIERKVPINCSTCGICFDQKPVVPLSMIGRRPIKP